MTFLKIALVRLTLLKPTCPKVALVKSNPFHVTVLETSLVHPNSTEIREAQINLSESTLVKVSPTEVSFPVNSTPNSLISQPSTPSTSEVFFSPSILSEQFFSIHETTPRIINALNDTATNIWSNHLQTSTPLDIDFQITDLPSGQLAKATITGFNEQETPKTETIFICTYLKSSVSEQW